VFNLKLGIYLKLRRRVALRKLGFLTSADYFEDYAGRVPKKRRTSYRHEFQQPGIGEGDEADLLRLRVSVPLWHGFLLCVWVTAKEL
jgi:hypothetical protein